MSVATPPTFEQLAEIMEDKLGLPRDHIRPETRLSEVDLDSLSLIEVTLTLRKQYGVDLPEEEVDREGTARDLHDLVLAVASRS